MKYPALKDLAFTIGILCCVLLVKIPYLNVILAAIVVIIYASINEERFTSVGFKKPVSWLTSFIQSLFLATVIVLAVLYLIQPTIEFLTQAPIDFTVFNTIKGNTRLLLFYILIGWVVGGISEEFIFRGFLINRITSYIPGKFGVVLAVLLTSTFFGYLHGYQGISGQITTGIIGAILGTIYLLSGRKLLLVILTHGLIDTILFLIIFFDLLPS